MSTPDPRPRPQYGEYASPDEALAAARARDPWAPPSTPPVTSAPQQPAAATRAPSRTDRSWTLVLLVLGGFFTAYAILTMTTLDVNFEQFYEVYGIEGSHQVTPVEPIAAGVVIVSHLALLVGSVILARRRLQAGRLAFWIPLAAGAIASVIFFVAFAAIVAADPNIMEYMNSIPALPVPTPTP